MNADTGKVIFAKNPHEPHYPASITKIATGLYTLKHYSHLLNKRIRCPQEALGCLTEAEKSKANYSKHPSYILETDMSHMGLKVGEEMLFRDLLHGTLVVSADDASNVIAHTAGNGSIESFMHGVNTYLARLGLKNTKFLNPHGLHHPEHVSTAYDIALLCREAMKDPVFSDILKLPSFNRPKTNKQPPTTLHQTNKLVVKTSPHYYPHALWGKTGYHRRARHNLASAAERNGRRLIAVVLNVDKRADIFHESRKLFEMAFAEVKLTKLLAPKGSQSFQYKAQGASGSVSTYEPLQHAYYPSEEPKFSCQLVWDEVKAPIAKGQAVGKLQLFADGNRVQEVVLYAANPVDEMLSHKVMQKVSQHPILWSLLGLVLLGVIFQRALRKRCY